jgi:hypothetical protein
MSPFGNIITPLYEKFSISDTKWWSQNKLYFNYKKTGRLSSFIYGGKIKELNYKQIINHLGNREAELNTFISKIKPHIIHQNIYLIGLESFFLPSELKNLKYSYLNFDANKTYEIIQNKSTVITPVFGGGTIQTEFEALCGVPALQKLSAYEFTEFVGAPTNCLPQILKKLQYATIVSNTFKPQPSFEALHSIGFDDINFPKETFPYLPSYLTNKNKIKEEYAIFDTDLYNQNSVYIQKKYLTKEKPIFNYMFSVWGHAFHKMNHPNRPKAIKVLNQKKLSLANRTVQAINQYYYRIKALQKYFDFIKKKDPHALVIAFSDHRAGLKGAKSYKEYGYSGNLFHNFIIIMNKGKYIKIKKPFPIYALPDIILDQLSNHWYCKNMPCKINSANLNNEQFIEEYYRIMANAISLKNKEKFFISIGEKYYFNNPNVIFKGFSPPESNYRWTESNSTEINFYIKKETISFDELTLKLNIGTFLDQNITIKINNHLLFSKKLNTSDIQLEFTIMKQWLYQNSSNQLTFSLPNFCYPSEKSKRKIAMKLKFFSLQNKPLKEFK